MVITREFINGRQRFTIDGETINRRELEIRCAKYFNWYGLQAMFHKLIYEGKFVLDIEGERVYTGINEMETKRRIDKLYQKIAKLEETMTALKDALDK